MSPEHVTELGQLKQADREQLASEYALGVDVPSTTLHTGQKIPLVGLGTWKSKPGEVEEAVVAAIKAGYRHIDCAAAYNNEGEVGSALARVFKEGVVKREDLFITTKLWNSEHAADRVKPALQKSLSALKLEYVDLYLMHWPVTGNTGPKVEPSVRETWVAMEGLVNDGSTKAIGVSNFSIKKIQDILEYASIKPAVNQVEVHPLFRNDRLIDWCKSQGIHVTAYSPLGSPDSVSMFKREHMPTVMDNPVVKEAAEKLGKNPGQVLIRWAVQHGTSVLPKSVSPQRIKSNLDVLSWSIPEDLYHKLSSLELQVRMLDGSFWLKPEGPYKQLSDLWDDPEEDERQIKMMRSFYNLDVKTPTAILNTGAKIPLLGLGTWKSEPGQVKAAVATAIRAGYRHIDCAELYKNEPEVGEALEEVFAEGVVKREELWITSKLWISDHAPDRVPLALENTLKHLRVDYVDLYLIHWPGTGPDNKPSLTETWHAMEGLVEKGLAKAIGVSNFSIKKLQALFKEARIQPAVVQVEVHPLLRNDALIKFCSEHNIHVTAYSPLGSPDSAAYFKRTDAVTPLKEPVVVSIADKLQKSTGQVLIRWGIQHGTSVLPKSSNPERIKSNLDVWDWELSSEDYKALSKLEPQTRMVAGEFLVNEKGPYKSIKDLWDDEI